MTAIRRILAAALALSLVVLLCPCARSQDAAKPGDSELDSLLERLADPDAKPKASAATPGTPRKPGDAKATAKDAVKPADAKARNAPQAKTADAKAASTAQKKSASSNDKNGKPAPGKPADRPGGAGTVAPKDQELDELLQKLGQTKETPAPDDRPRSAGMPGQTTDGQRPSRPERPDAKRLGGKDKEIDERLEELTGRRKRRKGDDGQRSGEVGQIIKEMRDVEEKLGKPDTGEVTRQEQKQIVRRIQTLIEQASRSGGSMGRMVLRTVRRPGRNQGQDQGSTTGAMARGAPATRPRRPTSQHANPGGRDIWGHLPPELRQEIENQFNEQPLTSKRELIDRYYLSVGKGKLVREE
jgi:hypothetical protein